MPEGLLQNYIEITVTRRKNLVYMYGIQFKVGGQPVRILHLTLLPNVIRNAQLGGANVHIKAIVQAGAKVDHKDKKGD